MIDFDQRLFGWLWKRARSLVDPVRPLSQDGVLLDDLAQGLAWVASAIAEAPMRIEAADDAGGIAHGVLRLPRSMDGFGNRAIHETIYRVRVALDATAACQRLARPPAATEEQSRVAALALAGPLRRELARTLPGIEREFARAASAVRATLRAPAVGALDDAPLHAAFAFALGDESLASPWLAEEFRAIAGLQPRHALGPAFELAERLLGARSGTAPPGFPLLGALLPPPARIRVGPAGPTDAPSPAGAGTERAAPAKAEVKVIELPDSRDDENPLVHSFEKVHTADDYRGGRKALDGMDELAAHEDALRELEMNQVIRTNEAARSVYRMDVSTEVDLEERDKLPECGSVHHRYDEWNGERYLTAHCRLASGKPGAAVRRKTAEADARTKREVRRTLESLEQLRRPRHRMPLGGEVDVDALVERYGFVRAGQEGSDRLYIDRRRVVFDMATVLLVDLSSSSDAWIAGQRVLDVERAALLALADVLDELDAPFAVGGFFSHTHRDCRYIAFKDFGEKWAVARETLHSVEPQGYTRIGPALRHATALLAETKASRRTVLLLTDGRPTDYDRYEGRYGVTDVRKACDEAHARGVRVVTLAITERRRPHLAAMFGETGYEVLSDLSRIAERLAAIETRLRS